MIDSTNLSSTSIVRLRQFRRLMGAGIAVCLALLAWELMAVRSYQHDVAVLDERLTELNGQLETHDVEEGVDYGRRDIEEMERRVAIVNEMIGVGGSSPTVLLLEFERLLPKNVTVSGFSHRPKAGEIKLIIESADTLALTAFVHDLEESPLFEQVLIVRQTHGDDDASTAYEIKIRQNNET